MAQDLEVGSLPEMSMADVRQHLLDKREIALVDVREEDPYAQAHPLFAVQLSSNRIELDAAWRLPRRDVPIVVYDNSEGLAEPAARKLQALGYSQVQLLSGGLAGWQAGGGELFRDVNVPSKSFGELVEHVRHTPSLPAEAVQALLASGANVVVLDARRFDEYQTMCIPGGTSVPGAELVLRVRDMAPDPATTVIVNCAGRTRSIIGTQSLINAGIPNPVVALRNGTIGWTLAGQALAQGQQRRFVEPSAANREQARLSAQALAERAGAVRLDQTTLADWAADAQRTLYRWDVRTPEEYAAGHLPGFGSAPGGQLVQETDVFAAVRGARIALADGGPETDGVRAAITAHWLAQLGWQVGWLSDNTAQQHSERGPWRPAHAPLPEVPKVSATTLAEWLAEGSCVVLDVGGSAPYLRGHLPGAGWLLRSELPRVLAQLQQAKRWVLVCANGQLSRLAAADLARFSAAPVLVLDGGQAAWVAAGLPLQTGEPALLSPRIDRYQRPYEGIDAPREAMQGYLDWEFGLVEQLARDASHGFKVLGPA